MDTIHRAGVAHGDLTPDNVIVSDEQVQLIDWECCRLPGIAHVGATPGYAGIEHWLLGDAFLLDQRSDLHALGVILGELLLSWPVPSLQEQFLRSAANNVAVPSHGGLDAWVQRLTHPHRPRRPGSLDGLCDAIDGARTDIPPATAVTRPVGWTSQVWDMPGAAELVPLHAEAESLRSVHEALEEAHLLRQQRDAEARWAALQLAFETGIIPWSADATLPAGEAYAALRFGASSHARDCVAGREVGTGSVTTAVLAATDAMTGNLERGTALLVRALRDERPRRYGACRVYWWSAFQTLAHTGRLTLLPRMVRALPRHERSRAMLALAPCWTERLNDLRRRLRAEERQDDAYLPFRLLALGESVRDAMHMAWWTVLVLATTTDSVHWSVLADAVVATTHVSGSDALRDEVQTLTEAKADDVVGVATRLLARSKADARPVMPLPSWAQDEPDWLKAMYAEKTDEPAPVTSPSTSVGGLLAQAIACLGRGEVGGARSVLLQALEESPRDSTVWTHVLQLCAVEASESGGAGRSTLLRLCRALQTAGFPEPVLAPWRMQADRIAGDPRGALYND